MTSMVSNAGRGPLASTSSPASRAKTQELQGAGSRGLQGPSRGDQSELDDDGQSTGSRLPSGKKLMPHALCAEYREAEVYCIRLCFIMLRWGACMAACVSHGGCAGVLTITCMSRDVAPQSSSTAAPSRKAIQYSSSYTAIDLLSE